MKKLVFAAIAAVVMVSVSNAFATGTASSVRTTAPADTTLPADTVDTTPVQPEKNTDSTAVVEKDSSVAATALAM